MGFYIKCSSPSCGNKQAMEGPAPTMGFEYIRAAQIAGYLVGQDGPRCVAFCSEPCEQKNLTKGGYLRKRMR